MTEVTQRGWTKEEAEAFKAEFNRRKEAWYDELERKPDISTSEVLANINLGNVTIWHELS